MTPADPPGSAAAGPADSDDLARLCIEWLTARGQSVAAAESLTGGLVTGALTSVAGASLVVRGAVVAYATELKATLLGVAADLLARQGPVDPDVAVAMAAGVRGLLGATYGVATTGVAGPGPADGHPAGTVFVAVVGPYTSARTGLHLPGDREQVRNGTVRAALSLLLSALQEDQS